MSRVDVRVFGRKDFEKPRMNYDNTITIQPSVVKELVEQQLHILGAHIL